MQWQASCFPQACLGVLHVCRYEQAVSDCVMYVCLQLRIVSSTGVGVMKIVRAA